jgi:AcrR family transcriptional regulator
LARRRDGDDWHRGLDRDAVVTAALRLIDEQGREALTMRRLATELRVEAASLYAHVAGKDDLVDAILDRVLDGIELPPPGRDPRQAIVEGFTTYRRGLLAHPSIVLLMTERVRFTRSQARLATRSITLFEEAGLTTDRAVAAHVTLIAYVLGFILQEVARPTAPAPGLIEADPVLRRTLAALGRTTVDERFATGLAMILDGALPNVRQPSSTPVDHRPRWPGDTGTTGVSSAGDASGALDRLRREMAGPGWVTEDPVQHLGPKLRTWLKEGGEVAWQLRSLAVEDGRLVVDVTWRRRGRIRDLRADAHALIGSFAEDVAFVVQRSDGDIVEFEVTTGQPGGALAAHGHLVLVRVTRSAAGPLDGAGA